MQKTKKLKNIIHDFSNALLMHFCGVFSGVFRL